VHDWLVEGLSEWPLANEVAIHPGIACPREAGSSLALMTVMRLAIASTTLAACSETPAILPLIHTAGAPAVTTPSPSTPLEVVSRSTAVPDPLPVRGSNVAYAELEAALGAAVTTATSSWSEAHRDHALARDGGWAVLVELTGADAQLDGGGRLVVGLDARATLRTRKGNDYLGQTQLACREGGLVFAADRGAPVVYRCVARIGRDLAGWLDAVPLDPPPPQSK
jgi:hypothetical protein